MKQILQNLILRALENLRDAGASGLLIDETVKIENTRDKSHGDFATNIAMVLAGKNGLKPRLLAEKIVAHLPVSDLIHKTEVAGPGFINFFLSRDANLKVIGDVLTAGKSFGQSGHGQGQSIHIEFVSANPTGPLHIGHGRGAAYGAAVANLLEAAGYRVHREYYINDSGRQMDILACSVYLRYLELCGQSVRLPVNAYQGDYIKNIANRIFTGKQRSLVINVADLSLPAADQQADAEKQLDDLIERVKLMLGADNYRYVFDTGLNDILGDINDDLREFGVTFDNWYSERDLLASNQVEECINKLKLSNHLYAKDGAWWFRSTAFGDEKDRVVVRENGQLTYFASDIAYHQAKFDQGYFRAIDVWGADHHGYIARIRASLSALGLEPEKLVILLVQFASLYRGNEKVQMSTRSGQFVTLRELRDEAGKDACRFFYIMRKSEQHLDFDLELAKSQSQDNPVYYIQYAHARICSVRRQLRDKGLQFTLETDPKNLMLLSEPHELALLARLAAYPETLLNAALNYEPHQIGYYLRDLANDFHSYYNACQILVDECRLLNARLSLCLAVRQVLENGLGLLGVSAPESM